MSASSRFIYGLIFSLTTALFWGMLPIALKLSNNFSDPITLTWFRFTVAGGIVWIWQKRHHRLGEFKLLTRSEWQKLALAGIFLMINYTCYAWSLCFLTPESSQLCMQVAPLFLALGGWFFFKEYISWGQWVCFAVLFSGLAVFFHPVFEGTSGLDMKALISGVLIIIVSALAWSSYALVQKSLFAKLDASNVLLAIYLLATVVMMPFSSPSDLLKMSGEDVAVVLFCCLNTVLAYGAFAKALSYWQTVQVSAVIAVTPVIAFMMTALCVSMGWWSDVIHTVAADWVSIAGMGLVIFAAVGIQVITPASREEPTSETSEPSVA